MSLASLEWSGAAGGRRKRGFRGFVVDMPLLVILLAIVSLGLVVLYSAVSGDSGLGGTFTIDPEARDGVLRQSALSPNDGYCSAAKGAALVSAVLAVVDRFESLGVTAAREEAVAQAREAAAAGASP